MKKFIVVVIALLMLMPVSLLSAESSISLLINGKRITQGQAPAIINGSTYIPLRNLFENISFSVEYNSSSKTAIAYYNKGYFKMSFRINSSVVEVDSTRTDGRSTNIALTNPAIMHKGSVYVPVRAFGELLGVNVRYDAPAKTVYFDYTDNQITDRIYPKLGVIIEPEKTKDPVTNPTLDSNEREPLTAKEIAKLTDKVGFVEAYDTYGNPIGTGSGFLINGGMFVTNSHVGSGNVLRIKVGGVTYDTKGWHWFDNIDADIYGVFLSTSYTSEGLMSGRSPVDYIPYITELPEVGDKVYLIGSPQGLENTLTEGIVSGIRTSNGITYIQHTADSEGGSSGGVLLNEYGEAIGVHSFVLTDGESLRFAIPMYYVDQEMQTFYE